MSATTPTLTRPQAVRAIRGRLAKAGLSVADVHLDRAASFLVDVAAYYHVKGSDVRVADLVTETINAHSTSGLNIL